MAQEALAGNLTAINLGVFAVYLLCCVETESFDLHRWQLSKTVKGDADDEIAKYDGLFP